MITQQMSVPAFPTPYDGFPRPFTLNLSSGVKRNLESKNDAPCSRHNGYTVPRAGAKGMRGEKEGVVCCVDGALAAD